ncbi:rod shape-determining protein RodA [Parasphingorhabdus cellanae]|uniref:Peptidoglycan glycosyltransferase MrdB n=1 Tax=Parasphingorhabdus cellanae TaxID=2806553 RepID=A0ABX7T680_9SPHN|nr:rod shape-determining protein RodA [Parasphingorhabdus cellanae]QTD56418.1 rod shape-determining protein RodA [Parasphingorhabdus cellanae]
MNDFIPAPIAQLPWKTILLLLVMASFGFIVLYSAAGGSVTPWAGLHMVRFLVFLGMAVVFSRLKENFWKTIAFPVYIVVVIMLLGVELMGAVRGGSQRWLSLGFIRVQPSELMKPAIILAVARFYDLLPAGQIRTWGAVWPLLVLLAFPCALILLQPDLGTTITVLAGAMTVAFLAGLPMRLFVGGAAAVAVIAPLAFFFGLEEYQQRRVTTFLNPENDPLGAGYHISQSKIAIGSGGIFGKGFLNGTQSHLDYLPEGHTDFVFATMAEEWGLMGGVAVLFGFFLLFRWGLGVAMKAKTRFSQLVAAGLSTTIFFYVAINLMMVMGLAPVVGIPLPFLSHGGSSMMTIMICIGILMAIDRHPGRRSGTFG